MADEDWTLPALKEYVERILEEREKRRDEQNKATLLALAKAEAALDHRLELLNEFRAQSQDQQNQFVAKGEFDALEKRYEERHSQLAIDVRLLQARVVPMLWVGSTLVLATIGVFISHLVTGTP